MSYLNRDERREVILQAAMRVALAEGFAAMTVRRIASEADVAAGQVHHHFSSAGELKALAFVHLIRTLLDAGQVPPPATLFLTAGLGSGSTFQMIAVIFRQITLYNVKLRGGSDEQAQREAVTDTAAALGFISAIGAVGGFFIPKAFGTSLALTGSPVGAMKIFLLFYIACVLLTWLVYGRRKPKQQ